MDSSDDSGRAERAVALAERLLRDAQRGISRSERRRQARLARIVADPQARELVQQLTDEVLRLERPRRAAERFARLVTEHGVPRSLGPLDRRLLAVGARLATRLPAVVMPLATRRIIAETRGLVIPAEDPALAGHVTARRAAGVDLNLNLLGEAILSDDEAAERVRRLVEVIRRPDVNYLSVKISAICALLDVYAYDHSLGRIRQALETVFDAAAAASPTVFVNLDMEEYADLHLTVDAFTSVLDLPRFAGFQAGIVLQAYLPDSHDVFDHLAGWARRRADGGGAPIKIRIVKGANLAMERVDAEQHGWVQAPYATKAEVDASYKRLLGSVLVSVADGSVRVGVASHNLFDIAWALGLRDELPADRRGAVEVEMLEGMVPAQARATLAAAGSLLLYCPIVRHDEIEASLAYLARRFDENTGEDNFLRAMFSMTPGSASFAAEAQRFRRSVGERLTVHAAARRPAVVHAHGDGFENAADSDFTSAAVRERVSAALVAVPDVAVDVLTDVAQIDEVLAAAIAAQAGWAARPASERAALLGAVAERMELDRFATLALMADEAGKTIREGDPEVSEAIDFARYYATAELAPDARPVGTVLVASPWNFPYAIPGGGVFAALMAGNTVILKPAPEVRRVAKWLVQQCWAAGIPDGVVQFVACPDDHTGRHLVTHDGIGTVILTGAYATAQMFLGWKPRLRLLAETSGKNALVITEAADVDAAIKDLVKSAFGHAGQKCSAASLAIVEAPLYDDPSFLGRLAAAVRTVRVGPAADPATIMGPLIAPPGPNLRRALTTVEPGESWLVEPRQLDSEGRLWSPGVRLGVRPGSWFHVTECFGPVLGLMRAADLDEAIRLQNATSYGLTAGLHSLDGDEIDTWVERVQAGNLYVNRHITGAIVQRQPFGGWKQSSVGGGPKAGGPDYVGALVTFPSSAVDPQAAAAAFAAARRWFEECDPAGLHSESNVHRYRPLPLVVLRVGPDTPAGAEATALAAANRCGTPVQVSRAAEESDTQLGMRVAGLRPTRVRLLTAARDELLAACHAADVAVLDHPVSADPSVELPRWLREQAVSRTRHRYGRLSGNRSSVH